MTEITKMKMNQPEKEEEEKPSHSSSLYIHKFIYIIQDILFENTEFPNRIISLKFMWFINN